MSSYGLWARQFKCLKTMRADTMFHCKLGYVWTYQDETGEEKNDQSFGTSGKIPGASNDSAAVIIYAENQFIQVLPLH